MPNPLRITVLISGSGSNLAAIISASKECADYVVSAVVSNNHSAGGLSFALDAAIPIMVVERKSYPNLLEFKGAVLKAVQRTSPDLVVLAGFMMVLHPEFIETFPNRIVNIHPSLLPKFPGLDTHARALAAGESTHGSSVHLVDAGVDTGPLIAQVTVPVYPTDTPEILKKRVQEKEYEMYPWVIKGIARREITLTCGRISYTDGVAQEGRAKGYLLFP